MDNLKNWAFFGRLHHFKLLLIPFNCSAVHVATTHSQQGKLQPSITHSELQEQCWRAGEEGKLSGFFIFNLIHGWLNLWIWEGGELLYIDLNLQDIQKHSETWDKVWQPPPRTYCCWCGMSQFLNKRTLGGKSQNEIDVLEYKPSDKILYLEFETKAFCYLTAWT